MTLNVLTLSTLFPDMSRPNFGVFVERQARELASRPDVSVTVVAPIGRVATGDQGGGSDQVAEALRELAPEDGRAAAGAAPEPEQRRRRGRGGQQTHLSSLASMELTFFFVYFFRTSFIFSLPSTLWFRPETSVIYN